MTPAIERLGIVGVGLIGGSLGLAARAAGLAREVVGLGRSQANLDVALERGIVDRAASDPAVLAGCDFVLLATPVGALAASARAIAAHLAQGAIVTDAGSVKARVVADCTAALGGRARFVGGHPIAGTEESGAGAADRDLFRGARCVLTPVAGTDPAALAAVRRLWEGVGMQVSCMPPEEHDRALALLSHVPHLLAFALALAAEPGGAAAGGEPATDVLELAGPSFRDATRVAASSPEMWRDILTANAEAVGLALSRLRQGLESLETAIRQGDSATLTALLARAREVRTRLAHPSAAPVRKSAATQDVVIVAPARGGLVGTIDSPGDKSIAHRALILAAVADGRSTIHGVGTGADNRATIEVLRALGVRVERRAGTVVVEGR
ncbi:MAG TPA: prephenate dehydrogenase/arogenate dehydrogenase family protein, partial [Candidatus Bathyarchaeia archaeon]|nr:prephenate dehydrogenase/arogenate dehydrogenase family protein [Candidatus Bathyarchaeia archaeon]